MCIVRVCGFSCTESLQELRVLRIDEQEAARVLSLQQRALPEVPKLSKECSTLRAELAEERKKGDALSLQIGVCVCLCV